MLAHSTKDIAEELTKLKKEKFDDELGFMHDIKNEASSFKNYRIKFLRIYITVFELVNSKSSCAPLLY